MPTCQVVSHFREAVNQGIDAAVPKGEGIHLESFSRARRLVVDGELAGDGDISYGCTGQGASSVPISAVPSTFRSTS